MSGLDGVNRGPRPLRPGETRGAKQSDKAGQVEGEFSIEPGSPPEAVEGKGGVGPRFSSLRERILAGVDGEKTKEEILREVIDDEVQRSFGKDASERMVESITQAFDDNEQLRALFNRLYGEALRGREAR